MAAIETNDITTPYIICNKAGYDYSLLMEAVNEILNGYSLLTMGTIAPVDTILNLQEYKRLNAYLTSSMGTSSSAELGLENGSIAASGFTLAGDYPVNPEGYSIYASAADPLLGDLLAFSYKLMAEGDTPNAIACIQALFLMIRIIGENKAPSLTRTEINGVIPYAL